MNISTLHIEAEPFLRTRAKERAHVPELDSLRALAALAVILSHYAPLKHIPFLGRIESRLGELGVDAFFTLSGFLITGMLLECRSALGSNSLGFVFRQFYIRRALRIFPLYYLLVVLFAGCFCPQIAANIWWFMTYTVNVGKSIGLTGFEPLNHFWSLAVEEQFYVVWPAVVLLMSRKSLLITCLVISAGSVSVRIILDRWDVNQVAVSQLTVCCVEPLAIGGIFAMFDCSNSTTRHAAWALFVFGVLSTALIMADAPSAVFRVWGRGAFTLCFAPMIFLLAAGSGSKELKWLRIKPLLYLGSISYGLYVYHIPIRWALVTTGCDSLFQSFGDATLVRIVGTTFMLMTTICISAMSWHYFERPINRLKRCSPYHAV
jgi:peptidoglycan/LPS O-acetylase OafA/YrhL